MTDELVDVLEPLRRSLGGPLVVHVVANGVRGDSRVLKAAQTTASVGIPVLLMGITADPTPEVAVIEGVPVVLIPFRPESGAAGGGGAGGQGAGGQGAGGQGAGGQGVGALQEWLALDRDIRRVRALRSARRAVGSRDVRTAGRSAVRLALTAGPLAGRSPSGSGAVPGWASDRPVFLDIVLALARALDVVAPAAVHCHDSVPLPAVVGYAARTRVRTRRAVRVLYDAHECTEEMVRSSPDNPTLRAQESIEVDFLADATVVTTVSGQIARRLMARHGLSRRPDVVLNAPSRVRATDAPSLRAMAGLGPEVPLMVYSGWVDPERGLGVVVRALPALEGVYLVIVAGKPSNELNATLSLARKLGVRDRIKLVGYVPPAQVTAYLSEADVGLIPRMSGGHLDLSLPTKYREYLHAGLPLVVSNNKAMARTTQQTGVGLVFRAGNVAGFAKQVAAVLARREEFRAAITPELLAEHSWEAQVPTLQRLYRSLVAGCPVVEAQGGLSAVSATSDVPSTGRPAMTADPSRAFLTLGIGPANYAGQAHSWAEAVRTHLGIAAHSFGHPTRAGHPVHRVIDDRAASGPIRFAGTEAATVLASSTHLAVDAFRRVLGDLVGDDVGHELPVLRRHLIQVALIAHGSEVRDPDRHAARLASSYFHDAPAEWTDRLREVAIRNRAIAADFDGPLFVSTPDLLLDLPGASWLPLAVDPEPWSLAPQAWDHRGPLRVLHQPSMSTVALKGSDLILPVLADLEGAGLIEIVRGEDRLQHEDMPALVARADVVIDQVRTGSYGVAAVEAMHAGRVVVGHVAQDVRELVPDHVPVVDALPQHLATVLSELAGDRDRVAALAREGAAYAATWHDGAQSAKALAPFLDLPMLR